MVRPKLILVLGDQLSLSLPSLAAGDPETDVVVMAEVMAEGTSVPHHPQKIALILSAMRKFAMSLRELGWRVAYSRLEDPDNRHSIPGELLRRAHEHGAVEVIATRPGEWRLLQVLTTMPLKMHLLADTRFICSEPDFAAWAEGRKQLRMEYFYRDMRRKTGLMMDGDKPAGGKWNYDHDNRKPASADLFRPKPLTFTPDRVTEDVLAQVEARFSHFGTLRPFGWATDRAGALQVLQHFLTHVLPRFGLEQDAMLAADPTLSHSLLSPYLNIGLLSPMEICTAVEAEWKAGRAPIEAAEGYIRQIIGWREYLRGIYLTQGPDYLTRNALNAHRPLPALYWGGATKMACLGHAVGQTRDMAYAHHIQRLMVTGNFAMLAGISPQAVHEWYLSVYIDAFEWVEVPNVIGMSQFADGGLVASKPYASSGAYINRMSDYCGNCAYSVAQKSGPGACPFNLLYWDFLTRHREHFVKNPRMAQMYRVWDGMPEPHRTTVLAEAEVFLNRLTAGEPL